MSRWSITARPADLATLMRSADVRGEVEQGGDREPVVDDHVGPGEDLRAAEGEQAGVTGAGAHEVHGHRTRAYDPLPGRSPATGRRSRDLRPVRPRIISAKLPLDSATPLPDHGTPGGAMDTIPIIVERAEWMDRAACKGRTPLFFGIAGERPERRARREAAARRVCAGCEVLLDCREMARANRENGFWGGETEEERAAGRLTPRARSAAGPCRPPAVRGPGLLSTRSVLPLGPLGAGVVVGGQRPHPALGQVDPTLGVGVAQHDPGGQPPPGARAPTARARRRRRGPPAPAPTAAGTRPPGRSASTGSTGLNTRL